MNWSELPLVMLITGAVLVGLYLSNLFYDANIPQYISRKVGHGVGGMAYFLMILLFDEPFWPVVLSISFILLLGGARLFRPSTFRGVGGTGRSHALAEIWFPLAGTVALLVGWVWLGNPRLAIVPILFMAWGDMVTGLIRARIYKREVKGYWGTLGMFITCCFIAVLFTPYWLSFLGAVVATLAERYTPLSHGMWDDNWTIIITSLAMMAFLGA